MVKHIILWQLRRREGRSCPTPKRPKAGMRPMWAWPKARCALWAYHSGLLEVHVMRSTASSTPAIVF